MTQSDGIEDQENSEDTLARLGSRSGTSFDLSFSAENKILIESKLHSELPERWFVGRSLGTFPSLDSLGTISTAGGRTTHVVCASSVVCYAVIAIASVHTMVETRRADPWSFSPLTASQEGPRLRETLYTGQLSR